MDENIFQNYSGGDFDNEDLNKYILSEQYIKDENKNLIPDYNKRYLNRKGYNSNSNINEKPNHIAQNNYKKKFLYNSYNNDIVTSTNYNVNYQYNKKKLSKSIKENNDNDNIYIINELNESNPNSNNKYLRMSDTQNITNNNKGFYSSMNTINKNSTSQMMKLNYSKDKNRNNNISNNINMNIENSNEFDDYNMNDNELLLNKNEFLKGIKEIKDLDFIDINPDDANNNNLIFKNNNFYINDNKNIYLNQINSKNKNYIKNVSEKKDVNNYNRVNLQNRMSNNLNMNQKNINTDKKPNNIRYSKKLSENIMSNNLSDNKNNNSEKKDFFIFGNIKKEKLNNMHNYGNKYNNLSIQNNYNTYTKLEDKNNNNNNNNIIKLRNSNFARYEKKFSDKLNISPSQKRYATLTNNKKEEENINIDGFNETNIYDKFINQKNINNNLRKKIEEMEKEIKKKNNIIKQLYFQNQKNKNVIQKLKTENESKMTINKELQTRINNYKKEIILLKNKAKYSIDNNNLLKDKYIREINLSKEKIRKYEHENNNLKILLIKNKDRQYSTDISKNNIYNSFLNFDEQSRELSNYKDFNKSVSISRTKNKINIPIFKRYLEDKDNKENKSSTDNLFYNIKSSN